MRKLACGVVMGLLLLFIGGSAWADDYLKIRHVSEAYEVMGQKQPASEEIVETWLSTDKARMNTSESSSVILRGDRQMIYILDHAQKTYSELPMNVGQAMSDMFGEMGGTEEQAQMMAQMMGAMMKINAKVVETGETRTVNQWNCRVYQMTLEMPMGATVSEICATEELGVDMGLYHKVGNAMMAGQQGFQEMLREMEKIKGISVLTTSTANVMGATMKTSEELLEHKKMSAPEGAFDIPAEYRKQSFMGS